MKPVRVSTAAMAGVGVALLTALLMQVTRNSGRSLPQHSWWEVLLVVALAGALGAAGWRVRDQVRTRTQAKRAADRAARAGDAEADVRSAAAGVMRGHDGPSPDAARRIVVLAQAGALGGGMLAGWYAGQVAVQLMRLNVPSARSAAVLLGALTAAGVALSVAGFVVQRWCTIPDDER